MNQNSYWIPVEKIWPYLQLEVALIIWSIFLFAIPFYYIIRKRISRKRKLNLKTRFFNTPIYLGGSTMLALIYWGMHDLVSNDLLLIKISHYIALAALILGAVGIVKIFQIYLYLYLFVMNMNAGVPRLIANMLTFLISLFVTSVILWSVFEIKLSALLATSAVFSLVLGLALQDTLGNFFSGIALQFDHSFKIGDWVEIRNGSDKWIGQIHEINWRATYLMSFADELIMIPNRSIAQGQLIIYSHNLNPTRLNQLFRFKYDAPIEHIKELMLNAIKNEPHILKDPAPATLVTEMTESWICLKIFYSLDNYEYRYQVGDRVITQILANLRRQNIELASNVLEITGESLSK